MRTREPDKEHKAFDLKEIFKQSSEENVVASPISIKLLLTVLAESAGQDVSSTMRDNLAQVLPYNHTLECARNYFSGILKSTLVTF